MSRTNPNKLPRRFAAATQLVFGEGSEDKTFLKCLRSLYSQNTNLCSKVDAGNGGTPSDVARAGIRRGDACPVIIIVDGDKPQKEYDDLSQLIKQHKNVKTMVVSPCMEALLLAILNGGRWPKLSSSKCKSEFEKKYINSRRRREQEAYAKVFTKQLLDEQRKNIKVLDELISLFEG